MSTEPKYPDIHVQLTGTDGNAFAILAKVDHALREAGHGDKVDEFMHEATSGNYQDLLTTCTRWVDVS